MKPKKILRRAYGWWKSQWIKDQADVAQEAVLLAGSARSGTTWLAELINYDSRYRYIFEPLNKTEVNLCRNFEERQYLNAQKKSAKFHPALEAILAGKIRNHWTDFYNQNNDNARRLIKCIRANFLLAYINKFFPDVPIVFLIRHPFAVAYSRMKLGWPAPLAALFQQKALHTAHLLPYQDLLKNATSEFEKQVLFWCLENAIPLQALENNPNFKCIFYEDLIQQPEQKIKELFQFLSLDFNAQILSKLEMPSQSVQVHQPNRSLHSWKENLAEKDIQSGIKLLKKFGLDRFYGAEVLPLNRI